MAKELSYRRFIHELIVGIIRPVAGPYLGAHFDVAKRDEDHIRIIAQLAQRGILQTRLDAIDGLGREIDPADMGAEMFGIEILIRLGLLPGAFRDRRQIIIARRIILIRAQLPAEHADDIALLDRH